MFSEHFTAVIIGGLAATSIITMIFLVMFARGKYNQKTKNNG